jgi:hypothetical protein
MIRYHNSNYYEGGLKGFNKHGKGKIYHDDTKSKW